MNDTYQKLFSRLPAREFGHVQLQGRIMSALHAEQCKVLRRKAAINAVSLTVSSLLAMTAGIDAWSSLAGSSITRLLSLAWSDSDIVIAHWQDYAMSVLEILPMTALCLLAAGFLAALWSGRLLFLERFQLRILAGLTK